MLNYLLGRTHSFGRMSFGKSAMEAVGSTYLTVTVTVAQEAFEKV